MFLDRKFFDQNFFGLTIFLTQKFIGPKFFFVPENFYTENIFDKFFPSKLKKKKKLSKFFCDINSSPKGKSRVCTLERKQQREPIGTSFILFSMHIIINIIYPNIRYLLLFARAAAFPFHQLIYSLKGFDTIEINQIWLKMNFC